MPDKLADFVLTRAPTADRPLLGLTVLVVEDSRFACEAMRLLCLRSGARIRRADTLRSAARHLQVYQPAVVIVDLGLPDGSGTELIAELAALTPRVPVILGTSGSETGEAEALAAGADGFLDKPISNLALFQQTVLRHLPGGAPPVGLRVLPTEVIEPDRIALRDDLALVAGVLATPPDARALDYIAGFLAGVARSAGDGALEDAASALARGRASGGPSDADVSRIAGLVQARLAAGAAI